MSQARQSKSLRLDMALVERARERAGLPADAPMGAVVRYALAELAGVDPAPHVDSTPGRGSITHRARVAA